MSVSLQPHGLQHPRFPCPSPSPRACSNSCPLSWWGHPTISSSVIPFSSCLQSFPASGSFPMSRLFPSGGQSIRALASVLPMDIQGWFPLGLTGWISLQSKGLSRVLSNTTVQKHKFLALSLLPGPTLTVHSDFQKVLYGKGRKRETAQCRNLITTPSTRRAKFTFSVVHTLNTVQWGWCLPLWSSSLKPTTLV